MASKYIVVAEVELNRFRERCNNEMENGYSPVGGMVVKGEGQRVEYFQSFILTYEAPKAKMGAPKKKATRRTTSNGK